MRSEKIKRRLVITGARKCSIGRDDFGQPETKANTALPRMRSEGSGSQPGGLEAEFIRNSFDQPREVHLAVGQVN